MFTGIVEASGRVKSVEMQGPSGRITVATELDLEGLGPGDSIAVDGVCLTITSVGDGIFTADVSSETAASTTLGSFVGPGAKVNIERPLTPQKSLGGHFVTGHVDAVGRIRRKMAAGRFVELEVEVPGSLIRQVVKKGSIAVDGVSLTVTAAGADSFTVTLIPHTLKVTNLSEKTVGARVNVETDILAKYVEKAVGGGLTEDFLKEHGFM